jgi:glycosyltransferase involved in cell wall biosynthesis
MATVHAGRPAGPEAGGDAPTVAIVSTGHALEDWIPRSLSFDEWLERETGGWMFNYIDALTRVGVRSVVVTHTEYVTTPRSFHHRPTGASVWAVPPDRHLGRVREWERQERTPVSRRNPLSVGRALHRHWRRYRMTPLGPLLRGVREAGCDAILSQDYENPRFDACVAVGRLLSIPVFASFQGISSQATYFERYTRPLAIRASAGLIIASQVEIQRVKRDYAVPDGKLANIPNPLDVDVWCAADHRHARAELGIPQDARVAISHGRIDFDYKGLDVMLEAWGRLTAERPDADLRLLLVGYGRDAGRLREIIATGRVRGLELREYVVDQDLLRLHLSAADAFAFAGRHEGFPVAVTEAMACGLPVVATAARGVTDTFERGEEDGGIVVPIDDVEALTHGLGRLLDDVAFGRALGDRARRRVEEHCSLDAVARRLLSFMTARGMRAAAA